MSINNIYTTQLTSRNDHISLTYLYEKVSKNYIYTSKKLEKSDNNLDYVPKYNEYDLLLKFNYNVQQLKLFAKTYKLKIIGNKQQLVSRIYSHLYLSNQIIKIQKLIK